MLQINYKLLDADMFSYYPVPKFWFRFNNWSWHKNWKNIRGFKFRLWKFGFSCHVGSGIYCNGRKWIFYIYDDYQNWLENGGF